MLFFIPLRNHYIRKHIPEKRSHKEEYGKIPNLLRSRTEMNIWASCSGYIWAYYAADLLLWMETNLFLHNFSIRLHAQSCVNSSIHFLSEKDSQ
jgi:hypothetical protein